MLTYDHTDLCLVDLLKMNSFTANKMDALFTANKPNRGSDLSRDDSSSVTSRSSANMSGKCKRCGDPESLPSKPLVKCPSCRKKRWHAHCHQPLVDPRNIPKDWKCQNCLKDTNVTPGSSLTVPSNSRRGPSNLSPESSNNIIGRICEEPGCMKPMFQSNLQFCQHHKIEQRHKKAAAMKAAVALVPSGSKPIKKKSLYSWKVDDDTKQSKRKRSSPTKRSLSYGDTEVSAVGSSNVATQQQRPLSQGGRNSAVSETFPARSTPMRTPQQRAAQFSLLAGMGSDRSPIDEDMNLSLGSASMAESPMSLMNADLEGDLMLHSARRTPQTTQPTTSPEYSPPPPVEMPPDELDNLWAEPDLNRDDSPGSQIHQELRAVVDQPQGPEATESLEQQLSPIIAAFTSIQERRGREPSYQPGVADGKTNAAHGEDQEMPDAPDIATVEEVTLLRSGKATATPQDLDSPSPALTSVSSSTTPGGGIILDVDSATESRILEIAESLEAKRKQTAVTFDTSELDSFLVKQAEPESELQPTPQELAETQIWGHINPSVVWPKDRSDEWLAAKRREIDARGGRKANYGKLLTTQVRKERAERGWHIHQNSEAVPDEKMAETARYMEELFGIKGIDDLIPGVRNAQLVMMEKPADENGKKKKKVKAYPVL